MSTITNITQVNANVKIQDLSVNDNNELQEISGWHKFGRAIADTFRNLSSSGRAQIASRNEAVINKVRELATEVEAFTFVDAKTTLSRLTEQKDLFMGQAIAKLGQAIAKLGDEISKEIAKEFGKGSVVQIRFTEKLDEISERIRTDSVLEFNALAAELHAAHKALMGDDIFYERVQSGEEVEEAIEFNNRLAEILAEADAIRLEDLNGSVTEKYF